MRKLNAHLLCFCLFLAAVAGAMEPLLDRWRWRVFTPKNGLPERNFSAILQTRNGLYYAAAGARLFRYDGYRWDELAFAGAARPDGVVLVLAEGRDGTVCAATSRDIWAYRPGASLRQIFAAPRILVAVSPERQVYFLASGHLHRLEGTHVHRLQAVEPVPGDAHCLAVDENQIIWAGTDGGILRQEGHGWKTDPDLEALGLGNAQCRRLFTADSRRLWANLHSPAHGWCLVARHAGKWHAAYPGAPSAPVLMLTGYPDGESYASTGEGGLYRFDPSEAAWQRYPHIWPGSVVSVAGMVDDRDVLWLCLSATGIARFDARSDRWQDIALDAMLPGERVLSLLADADGTLWIGTEHGLYHRSPTRTTRFTQTLRDMLHSVTGLAQDAGGRIWVSSSDAFPGAWILDGGRWSHYRLPAPFEETPLARILVDRHGRRWMLAAESAQAGAWCDDGAGLAHFTVEEGLPGNVVHAVHVAADGALWFGTDRGAARLALPTGGSPAVFTSREGLALDRVWDIGEGKDGSLWFAHRIGGGVSRHLRGMWRRYGNQEGLANENVWSVKGSPLGDMWFGTQSGVSRFDGEAFYSYEVVENPLVSNVWPMAVMPHERGILLGTMAGGVFLLRRNDNEPPHVFPADNPREVPFGQPVRLSWHGRDRFDSTLPQDLVYLLELDGVPRAIPRSENSFVARGLGFGRHTLLVHARDQDGNQAPVPLAITFHVTAPWHRRPWVLPAGCLLAAFLAILCVLAARWRTLARKHTRALSHLVEATGDTLVLADRRGRITAVEGRALPHPLPGRKLQSSPLGRLLRAMDPGDADTIITDTESWQVTALPAQGFRMWRLVAQESSAPEGPPREVATQAEALARASRHPTPPCAFLVQDAAADALAFLPAGTASRVRLSVPAPSLLWSAWGDRKDFADALLALILNALETQDALPVVVSLHNERLADRDYAVTAVVRDLGPGPPQDPWRACQPFVTTKPGHRGLGLTLALGCALRNSARIRLERAEDGGTRACLTFPAAKTR